MSSGISRTTYVIIASSSVAAIVAWRVLQWRARKRARTVAARAQRMVQDGPMIDTSDAYVRLRILNTAIRRAQKWMSFQSQFSMDQAKTMGGQVGGLDGKKRPMLTLPPDYILKPLHSDDRGFREVAFYEALKLASQRNGLNDNPDDSRAIVPTALHNCDSIAMWLAIFVRDQIVAESEHTLVSSWRAMNKEVELLKRLANFTPNYYGVIGQDLVGKTVVDGPIDPKTKQSEISSDSSYLMLNDTTANFSKPSSIDLKIGRIAFEPDAPQEKKDRELQKYPQQDYFGFRIVGMRIYDPHHPEADPQSGYRKFDKDYGKSIETWQQMLEALRIFFHCPTSPQTLPSYAAVVSSSSSKSNPAESDNAAKFAQIRTRVIMNLLSQLRVIRRWFEDNKSLGFYSTSIFMVFEGDCLSNGGQMSNRDVTNLKMIDFCHVRRQAGGDEGYLHGLKNILQLLTELLEDAAAI